MAATIVDGLGRPISNAEVEVYWLNVVSENDVRKSKLLKLVSDQDGVIKGNYDDGSLPAGEKISLKISKKGYRGFDTPTLRSQYVLKRKFSAADVSNIAKQSGELQVDQLRELLSGVLDDADLDTLVFVQEQKFRDGLRALILDSNVGSTAGRLISFIGEPDDIRLLLDFIQPKRPEPLGNRWAYNIVSALVEPTTEKEWAFLRDCAIGNYSDAWVVNGAIKSLKLIASPKSIEILDEVGQKNTDKIALVTDAINYIKSEPTSLSDKDISAAGKKVAKAITIGKWKGNLRPQYNQRKDKALVAIQFIAGRDLLIYSATFHKINGIWEFRGVRETLQALLPLSRI